MPFLARKILNLIVDRKTNTFKIKKEDITKISDFLLNLKDYWPTDFGRKPRSLEELPRWKA